MKSTPSRRDMLHAAIGTLVIACGAPLAAAPAPIADRELGDLEKRIGGRIGVFALDTGNGRRLAHRPDERFPMCSTFKWVLAAAVLARVDRQELSLDERIAYDASALLEHAPVTREHVAEGALTIGALAHAAVTVSDNTAANLLLARIGGPDSVTQLARANGDETTRLDRTEPALNAYRPGDLLDTTSPRAMAMLMRQLACGDALSPASREQLLQWLRASETGKARLRAGFPSEWSVGDKTGTGARGTANDVAIAWPPQRAPIVVAAYLSDGAADGPSLEAAHAEIGRIVARRVGP